MQLPPLNALRAFEATARLMSLSKAGDELHVTHAAISHQLKHLEAWLGRKLLQKSGRGVALTPAGAEYYLTVSGSLAAIAHATGNMRRDNNMRSITVGCIPSIASRWLVPALPSFRESDPDLDVRIVYARAEERFDDESLDVLITMGEDLSGGRESRLLFSRRNQPVASVHYLAKRNWTIGNVPFATADLLHDESVDGWKEWFRKTEIKAPEPVRGPIFQDFNILATAVIAGHGVALCPVEVFRREIDRGDLVVLSDISTAETQGYYLITSSWAKKPVRRFTEWFTKECRSAGSPIVE
ncbi:LysR substrate-binding domain-containing protein [Rhizobium redzepovicii]|uniref:LysR substrate-binding domain-containing protein n=1 Tax=Rhizobium redzepovicii TaxID=2867518 RepID=A0AAW8NVL9_9HYPH|nr:LysR substrate-binding domain-containing protein [Rhizobium redzepovicii]MDR9758386.1 LysR substrate-binding domain-containing protein [Rhizobium redzepovicii]